MKKMTIRPAATYSTRTLSLLMTAAFAGVALWLFVPWSGGTAGLIGGSGTAALPPSLRVDGAVSVTSNENIVTGLDVPLAVRGEERVLIPVEARLRAETSLSESASAAVPAAWTITWRNGNGDRFMDPGERAVLTVTLPSWSSVHPGNELDLVLRTSESVALTIENVLQ